MTKLQKPRKILLLLCLREVSHPRGLQAPGPPAATLPPTSPEDTALHPQLTSAETDGVSKRSCYFNTLLQALLQLWEPGRSQAALKPASHRRQALSCPGLCGRWHTRGTRCSLPALISRGKGRNSMGKSHSRSLET